MRWCDTRDMTADAHTKGSIDRKVLLQLMLGIFAFVYKTKDYQAFNARASKSKTAEGAKSQGSNHL